MKPFSLTLKSSFVFVSQLQQIDLNLPYGFEINGDKEFRFDFQLKLDYEHLHQHPVLFKLFREKSDLYRLLSRPSVESTLMSLTKLVGTWETPTPLINPNTFRGYIPYNAHNLEVFLEYFRD